jgi:DAK2 domain fusion protein YloV
VRARALELAHGALASIEASRSRIDDLNVYPVPDGDTGSNLTLTWREVVYALENADTEDPVELARVATRAALLSARGNSGVILSQVVRGAAESLAREDDLAGVLRAASDAAYGAVKKPVEGTMLTAARELAEEAEAGGDLRAVVARGDDCVARTREMLPVLTEAGVVDAGAAGLVELVRGIASAYAGEPLSAAPPTSVRVADDAIHQELSRYRYCTTFVLEGDGLDAQAIERELEPLGDSLLVVGDSDALKIHVHTDDPGRALSLAAARGTIAGVEVANMHEQAREREARLAMAATATAVVAVADGDGNRRLLESLGAHVVGANPSTGDLLAAIDSVRADEVIVLPNDRNVVLAAEQAAAEATRAAHVLPTDSLQAGLAALVPFDPAQTAALNLDAMRSVVDGVATGAVTIASRDVEREGITIRKGEWLGLADGEPVAGEPSFDTVARVVVDCLLEHPRDVLTLLTGQGSPPLENLLAAVAAGHPGLEVEVHDGGQAHYALLLSAE